MKGFILQQALLSLVENSKKIIDYEVLRGVVLIVPQRLIKTFHATTEKEKTIYLIARVD